MRLGIVHPGSMGSTVGKAAAARAEVLWAGKGRSEATARRAADNAFQDVETVDHLASESDVIISLVPPAAAEACAVEVAAVGFVGVYVDANAISPQKTRRLARIIGGGASFVDGGVVGPPAHEPGTTRLYMSGEQAEMVADLFSGSVLEAIELGPEVGAASALKMAYAAYTKGSGALIMAIRALAQRHHIDEELLAEWDRSLPDLVDRSDGILRGSPRKAWRFTGEMEEIAATFHAAGLPAGFHDAAGELYRRIGPERDGEMDAAAVVELILAVGNAPQAS